MICASPPNLERKAHNKAGRKINTGNVNTIFEIQKESPSHDENKIPEFYQRMGYPKKIKERPHGQTTH